MLFDYLCIPCDKVEEVTGESLERYARNVVLILNAIFEYGFLKAT